MAVTSPNDKVCFLRGVRADVVLEWRILQVERALWLLQIRDPGDRVPHLPPPLQVR